MLASVTLGAVLRSTLLPLAVLAAMGCARSDGPPTGARVASLGTPPPPTGPPPSLAPPAAPRPPSSEPPPPASPPAPVPSPSATSDQGTGTGTTNGPTDSPTDSPTDGPTGFRTPLGPRQLAADEPAMRYANLSSATCRKELQRLGLPVDVPKKGYAHVGLPVRITGPMHGVRIRTAPASSKYGVLDCRLALALDAMAEVLGRHGVTEVRIGNIYRPGSRIGGRRRRSQHSYGLAADVSAFVNGEGEVIAVEGHWGASIGDQPCGPEAVMKTDDPKARFMRDAVCDLSRQGVFHHILTPSANAAHRNHFHFDIERDARNRWIR